MVDSSFWNGKKVFLTGHTGFKGAWLSIWLNELGADILGYALEPNTTPSLYRLANVETKIKSVIGDIRNFEFLKETMVSFAPDIVIHLAAQPLVRESYENPTDTYSINVMGTVNVLESVRHCKSVKAVVNVTTDKVYENKELTRGYHENDVLGGFDPYSNSKACSELVTSSYIRSFFNTDKYAEHGVAIATARAGNVIGGGDWAKDRLIPDTIRSIENNEPIIIRNPNAIRPWQHVLEPLSGYLMLAEKLYSSGCNYNGAWNFGPNIQDARSVQWVVNEIKEYFRNYKNEIIYEKSNLHETNQLKLDCSYAIDKLGWKPVWDIEETIMHTTEWYNNEDKLIWCKKQIALYCS